MALTERQKRFAKHYARTGIGAKSARLVGYSEHAGNDRKRAYVLMTNSDIGTAVKTEQEKILDASNLTADDITNLIIKEAVNNEVQDGARIRAQELLGKTMGLFRDVQETKTIADMNERDTIIAAAKGFAPQTLWGMATDLHCADFEMVEALRLAGYGEHAGHLARMLDAGTLDVVPDAGIDGDNEGQAA